MVHIENRYKEECLVISWIGIIGFVSERFVRSSNILCLGILLPMQVLQVQATIQNFEGSNPFN